MALDLSTVRLWNAPATAGVPTVSGEELLEQIINRVIVEMTDSALIVGSNDDVDVATSPEDIWVGAQVGVLGQTQYVFPTGAEPLDVVSTDVNDTAAGTGARTIRITGMGTDFAEISETVTLNGLTPVQTVASFFRVNDVRTILSGSTGFNQGNILMPQTTSGVDISAMQALSNRGLNAIFTVADKFSNGTIISLAGISVGRQAAVDVEVALFARRPGESFVPELVLSFNAQGTSLSSGPITASPTFPIGTDFRAAATVSANNTGLTASVGFNEPGAGIF